MRLEISERRAGKNPTFGIPAIDSGNGERRGKIRRDRIDAEAGKILAQGIGLRFQKVAGNIHGNVGLKAHSFKQAADLGGGARAEFHQRRALRQDRRYRAAAIAQDRSSLRVG
jgi:hypothetical protein